ncbi:subtilisin-like serine protease [Geranomyces variabilis]|nr:subtilisin-like serine protease [Geranomyces variabilis]
MVRLTALVCLALASFAAATPVVRRAPAGTVIKDQYVITFKKANSFAPRNVDSLINELLGAPHALTAGTPAPGLLHKYDFGSDSFQGFAANIKDKAVLERIKASGEVDTIEEDHVVTLKTTQSGLPSGLWGIDSLDGSQDGSYTYPSQAGSGVDAYVIDTGCQTTHPEFQGRATWGASFTGETSKTDGNGHGTHVSGTIGGKTYGVAKKVNIICVRVLNAQGSGSNSGVIAGINWAASAAKKSGRKSVANMSLGGGKDSATDKAAQALVAANVALAVAAGNDENTAACDQSPAGASGVLTVAASDSDDTFAYFSSYGNCVEIIAPGVDILSSWKGSSTNTISGTSMATPHVVGALALAYSTQSFSSVQAAYNYITSRAASGQISSVPSGTPNKFLQI